MLRGEKPVVDEAAPSAPQGRLPDIHDIVDHQQFGWRSALFVGLAMLVLVSDGFDLAAIGYVAPALANEWRIDSARLVPIFSAGIIGLMIGGPTLGMLGDRFGRRRLIVAGLCVIGVTSLASTAVTSATQLIALRFVTGLGLGGVVPNVIALVAEGTPKRFRGRLIIIVALGMVLGSALCGLIASRLIPLLGWRAILIFGGVLPLFMATLIRVGAPESLKFLLTKPRRRGEALLTMQRMRPDLKITEWPAAAAPTVEAEAHSQSVRQLFAGPFRYVTPLLWICQACNQMANYFSLTWLPILLQSSGISPADASVAASFFAVGGLVGGMLLLFVVDRLGVIPLSLMFLAGAPLIATMVLPGLPLWGHEILIAGAGLCSMGIQLAITPILGILYPTAVRSSGTGWAHGVGRVGALAAPVVGGVILSLKAPPHYMTLAPSVLFLVGALASGLLAIICFRHVGGWQIDELSVGER